MLFVQRDAISMGLWFIDCGLLVFFSAVVFFDQFEQFMANNRRIKVCWEWANRSTNIFEETQKMGFAVQSSSGKIIKLISKWHPFGKFSQDYHKKTYRQWITRVVMLNDRFLRCHYFQIRQFTVFDVRRKFSPHFSCFTLASYRFLFILFGPNKYDHRTWMEKFKQIFNLHIISTWHFLKLRT